jgi:phospholipid/cholesterol/gamma-HCH transport system substrate-binding protein
LVTPFKVGLLVIVALAAFMTLWVTLTQGTHDPATAITVFAYFDDASGIGPKSRVQTAGIPVGEVSGVRLEGTRARVELRIRRDVPLKKDAALVKRSESILGDYLIDLVPGSPGAPLMPEGGQIAMVNDRTGMEEAVNKLNLIAGDIQEVTRSLREVFGGEEGANNMQAIVKNLVEVSASLDTTLTQAGASLNSALVNIDALSRDVRKLADSQDENIAAIFTNVRGASEDVREVLGAIKRVLGTGEGELTASVQSFKDTLGKLDEAIERVQSIAQKIDEGEGPVGRLINDERLGENLGNTLDDVSNYLDRMVNIATEVSLRSEYLVREGSMKNVFGIKLIPKPDKYYLIELIDDPRGNITETTVRRYPPDLDETALQTVVSTDQAFKFSAQFAKRFYFATLRFGIIESTGGVGGNLHFFDDALTINLDLFDFASRDQKWPRFRASLNYSFLGHLFVSAGVDDIINRPKSNSALAVEDGSNLTTRRVIRGRDFFFGAGFYFTDEDLKGLLSSIPTP